MIEIVKKYRTRDGRNVRIYATDSGNSNYPVHGAILCGSQWEIKVWSTNGELYIGEKSGIDIVEVLEPKESK